jgi:hypothetical protein
MFMGSIGQISLLVLLSSLDELVKPGRADADTSG